MYVSCVVLMAVNIVSVLSRWSQLLALVSNSGIPQKTQKEEQRPWQLQSYN